MRTILIGLCVILLFMGGFVESADAYSAEATFFIDGINIEIDTAYTHWNPTIVIIAQNRDLDIEKILQPPQIDFTYFDASVDFYFGLFDPTVPDDPTVFFVPDTRETSNVAGIALLDIAFGDITSIPSDLVFNTIPVAISPTDVVILLTNAGEYFKIGNFVQDGLTEHFDVELVYVIPEPSTLLLFGLGLLGLVGIKRWGKKLKRKLPFLFLILLIGTTGMVFGSAEPVAAQFTGCGDVTEIPPSECEALVALYNSTGGPSWDDPSNWLVTNTFCRWKDNTTFNSNGWYGVNCEHDASDPGLWHVTEIWLWDKNLSGSIPAKMENLTELKELTLASNNLSGTIPTEFWNLTNLESLDLADNPGLMSAGIPPEIGNLTKLIDLDLSGNNLSGSIPPGLWNLSSLVDLDLANNPQLSDELPSTLPITLSSLTSFYFNETDLCEPLDNTFQDWLASFEWGQLERNVPCDRPGYESYFGYHEHSRDAWEDAEQDTASDRMCWAAAASNVLFWTRWNPNYDGYLFDSSTEMFDAFRTYWSNDGGLMYYGWQWWFTGSSDPATYLWPQSLPTKPGWATVSEGGGYFPYYPPYYTDILLDYYKHWGQWNAMQAIEAFLQEEYGVTISVYRDIQKIQDPEFGHALTVWGIEKNQAGDIESIWVTDSLHNPNRMTRLPVRFNPDQYLWYLAGGDYPYSEDDPDSNWFIGGVHSLRHSSAPSFKRIIDASVDDPVSGSILPSGKIGVVEGDPQSFTIAPATDLRELLVDGSGAACVASDPGTCTYTFPAVTSDHSIQAIFLSEEELATITTSVVVVDPINPSDKGGQISPAGGAEGVAEGQPLITGVVKVKQGEAKTFTFKSDPGYRIMDVLVDGKSQGPAITYTLNATEQTHKIQVKFTKNTNKLAIVKKKCVDPDGIEMPCEKDICHQAKIYVGDQELSGSDKLTVATFSTKSAVVLQTVPTIFNPTNNPNCPAFQVEYRTSDGKPVNEGLFDVEDDIVLTGIIGCNRS
ncbi:hypothetical protein U27_03677 [Candidatus Vecturithrix granuli]|uniref:Ice-binding protein C-terminal domain-containing protein n=1 Tax=Vecturithrix granuli TaxID=1499967 RepID=A0A081BWK9_VECG1|nr:hypothetical protein U27_03677 [Candidatus Vecturithrix granuli]